MADYTASDFTNIVATDNGYTATVKGVDKTLSRDDSNDSEEIALLDFITTDKPSE